MMNVNQFLYNVHANAARVKRYQAGHDGSDGACDCIGLPIGALRMGGVKWPWTHGSNYAARSKTENLRPVSGAGDLILGDLVYKAKEPGEDGYNLPDTYKDHPDKRDYCHVGVVTSLSPLEITHCTKYKTQDKTVDGIEIDTRLGQWKYAGELALVDYTDDSAADEDGENAPAFVPYFATVHADNGKDVRLRVKPSTKDGVGYSWVQLGTEAEVLEEVDATWARVRVNGSTGYMMRKFLLKTGEAPELSNTGTKEQAIYKLNGLISSMQESIAWAEGLIRLLKGVG